MKNLIFTLCILIPSAMTAGPPSKYIKAMEAAIHTLFQSESTEQYIASANTFERIGLAEEKEWHPHYYLALTHILMSTQDAGPDEIDQYLDMAQVALETAIERHGAQSAELTSLQGFIHMLRIPVDPATRGPQYSGMAIQELSKAIALGPQNPRAHYLMANMQMGTARFFGNDFTEACSTLEKSIQLFEKQTDPEHPLDPTWGKAWAVSIKERCDQ